MPSSSSSSSFKNWNRAVDLSFLIQATVFLVLLLTPMHPPRLRILGGDVEADVHGGIDDLEADVFEAQQVQADLG
jgi:hypothetical protein